MLLMKVQSCFIMFGATTASKAELNTNLKDVQLMPDKKGVYQFPTSLVVVVGKM